ncbi:hypothetical protein CEXT_169081 [Caerostris extrusa]|uniref:Secreted protein n=1 Tax=Caerostris extrusa TaxID=172846 RepID=A0AAV4S7M4_CAEEX|nr:hypothetical protein CEXT_169081 [Caerostris extrusa]
MLCVPTAAFGRLVVCLYGSAAYPETNQRLDVVFENSSISRKFASVTESIVLTKAPVWCLDSSEAISFGWCLSYLRLPLLVVVGF